jgi:hypothetical protein
MGFSHKDHKGQRELRKYFRFELSVVSVAKIITAFIQL